MRVGILTIGNELVSGKTQDTNSSLIAREMNEQGWPVTIMMSVGDDENKIRKALETVMGAADAIIVTGGLGPTSDDITTAAIARAFNLPLFTDEKVLAHVKSIFEKYRLKWTENNAKQALFPEGSRIIANPVGTAAGFALEVKDRLIAVIPGVPFEVRKMLPEGVIPLFKKQFPQAVQHMERRTIKLFGLSEASVDEALADLDLKSMGVEIGFYPNFPENHIVLIARHDSEDIAKHNIRAVFRLVESRLGEYIIAHEQETLEGVIAGILIDKKITLAVAESCTGGLITDRLTDIPGSSEFLERGVVTYSNKAKTELLSVPEDVIGSHGAVSEQVAQLMAEGVRRTAGTNLGLSVTGIAGPAGGSEDKPVGTVYIALADGKETVCRKHSFRWDRRRNKVISSQAALVLLKRYLEGSLQDG